MLKKFIKLYKGKAGRQNKAESSVPNTDKGNQPMLKAPIDKVEMWDGVGRVCIYSLFGVIPLFFLPVTSFPVIENKFALAGALVLTALGAWLVKVLNFGKISLPKTKLWLLLALFIAIAGVSAINSEARQVSVWGNLSAADSLSHFVMYALAFFLVPLFLRETKHLIKSLLFFSISLLAISVFSLLQLFGVFILPFDFSKSAAFNPIGNPQALAIFLGSGLVMLMALLASFKFSRVMKVIFFTAALLLGSVLLVVNFSHIWLGLFLSSVLFVSWQVSQNQKSWPKSDGANSDEGNSTEISVDYSRTPIGKPKFGLPMAFMVIVAILFFLKPPVSSFVEVPSEVRPNMQATLKIASQSLKSDVSKTLFGSGPSTFMYEYLRYRPQELNTTAFWDIRFSQGFSAVQTMLITLGILGTGLVLAVMGAFTAIAFRGITAFYVQKEPLGSKKTASTEKIALISFASFLFLVFFWFIYPVNFSIYLFTFLFMGLVISALTAGGAIKTVEFSFIKNPRHTFVVSAALIVMIVFVVVAGYWHAQKYVASIFHGLGVAEYNKVRNVDRAITRVNTAINLDNSRDAYWRTLSELLDLKTREIANSGNFSSPDTQRRYQVGLQGLIQSAQNLTKTNPSDPLNWRHLGAVYESNIQIVRDSEKFAIKNYEEAMKRNPNNPREYVNLARAYVLAADGIKRGAIDSSEGKTPAEEGKEYLKLARDNLQKAIALKSDYSEAHFMISQVYERLGERALAIQKNIDARNLNPQDTGVGYQLGLLYYLDGQFEKARAELERVVSMNANFSNARYFLGLSWEKLGNTQAAIENFVKIEELNPGNSEVERILSNLRAGRGALETISPPAPAPEERLSAPLEGDEEIGGPDPLGE